MPRIIIHAPPAELPDVSDMDNLENHGPPTGGAIRQKPDITAADGVATSVKGFQPFYGTSAAAPHAVAIAALLLSGKPTATPDQIRTALVSSATDLGAVGVDLVTGAGVILADPALAALGVVPK